MPKKVNGSLREACIEESLAIIAERGIKNLSIREVARRLGVSHGAPYRHFKNREVLIAEIALEGMRLLETYLMRGIDYEEGSGKENFVRFCQNYIAFAQEQHDYFQLILWSDLPSAQEYPALKSEANQIYLLFNRLVHESGIIPDPSSSAGPGLTLQVLGTVHGLASLIASKKLAVLDYKKDQLEQHAGQIIASLYDALV